MGFKPRATGFRSEKRSIESPSHSVKAQSIGFKDSTKMVALPPVSRGSTRMSGMRQLMSPEAPEEKPQISAYVNVNPYGP